MPIFSSIGGAPYSKNSVKVIRLVRKGCVNRPFFHIAVMEKIKEPYEPVIEQIGNYDPLPNKYNEKLVAINFKRLDYWLREGAEITKPVLKLLGLSGYFPVHPDSFLEAWNNRKTISEQLEELKITAAGLTSKKASESTSDASAEPVKAATESMTPESSSPSTETVLVSSVEPLSEATETMSPESPSTPSKTILSSFVKSISKVASDAITDESSSGSSERISPSSNQLLLKVKESMSPGSFSASRGSDFASSIEPRSTITKSVTNDSISISTETNSSAEESFSALKGTGLASSVEALPIVGESIKDESSETVSAAQSQEKSTEPLPNTKKPTLTTSDSSKALDDSTPPTKEKS